MTISNTTRFALTQWSSGDDDFTREQLTTDHEKIGNSAALFLSGVSASPPAAETSNTKAFYWDSTNGILYYRGDLVGATPSSWQQIHPVVPSAHVHSNLQPISAELTSVAALDTLGFPVRTATGTYTIRHIVVGGNGISVSNPFGTAGNPTIELNSTTEATAATLVYRDANGQFKIGTPTEATHAATKGYVDTADGLRVLKSGDTMTGLLTLSGAPSSNLHAATKLYVDTADNLRVLKSGDTMTGLLTLSGTPTDESHAATKSYVDTADALKANANEVYKQSDIHNAKLYQYANEAGGTGAALPSSGTRSTPRIYVQSTEPSSAGAITGDIWFQI